MQLTYGPQGHDACIIIESVQGCHTVYPPLSVPRGLGLQQVFRGFGWESVVTDSTYLFTFDVFRVATLFTHF